MFEFFRKLLYTKDGTYFSYARGSSRTIKENHGALNESVVSIV